MFRSGFKFFMHKDSRIFLCNSVGADVSMVKLLGLIMWSLESECCLIEECSGFVRGRPVRKENPICLQTLW